MKGKITQHCKDEGMIIFRELIDFAKTPVPAGGSLTVKNGQTGGGLPLGMVCTHSAVSLSRQEAASGTITLNVGIGAAASALQSAVSMTAAPGTIVSAANNVAVNGTTDDARSVKLSANQALTVGKAIVTIVGYDAAV